MKNLLFVLICGALFSGCSKIDDYMLGKDNTPRPKELNEIHNKIKVSQNWSTPVGKTIKYNEYLRLHPVVRQDTIYTANANGTIQAVKQSNGLVLWTTQLKHGLVSGPVVSGHYIAVGTNNASVVLLSKHDGKKLWQATVTGEVLSPPAISNNKVIVKTIDGKVYAFNAADGKQLWLTEHGAPSLILKASSSPIVNGNLVLVGFSDGKFDALDIETGRLIWQRSIAYASGSSDIERLVGIDSDPIVEHDVVYLASYQGHIGALSLSDGQFLWKKPASVYKNMVLNGDSLYVTDSHDVVWSINKRNGHVNWKQTALKARVLTEPTLVKHELVVGDKTGYLHFMDLKTGKILARSKVSSGVSSSPYAHGRALYVMTDNGMLNQLTVG